MSRCGVIILAAGGSTRMGSPKQLLQFEGTTLLRRAANTALDSVCRPVVAVLGAGALEAKSTVSEHIEIVINERWSLGVGTSIRAGISAIEEKAIDAVMILLCDQPLIVASALNAMVDTHFAKGRAITAAYYSGSHGTPVIFSRSLFSQLLELEDHEGGKAILQRYKDEIQSVDLPEAENDIDTRLDFEKVKGLAETLRNMSTG